MALNNRFVRSATWEGLADSSGRATPALADLYTTLVKGGIGLIITGHAYISPEGMASPMQLGIYDDRLIEDLAALTDNVHDEGGKIAVQISHSGCHGSYRLNGLQPVGPSVMKSQRGPDCRELSVMEIERLVEGFVDAARRAESAGFDAIQLHAAHGYLLSQFLSPFYNRRADEFGSGIGNRAKVTERIIRKIKADPEVQLPVLVKMNSEDFIEGGLTVDEMLEAAAIFESAGAAAIELSGGTIHSPERFNAIRKGAIRTVAREVYYREAAVRYKERIGIPLMLVGGIRSYEASEQLVASGTADYVSMSRPLICEPDLINRWRSGDKRPSGCLNDNMCFTPAIRGRGLRCSVKERPAHLAT